MSELRIRGGQPGEGHRFELRVGDSLERSTGRMMYRFRRIDRRENVYYDFPGSPRLAEPIEASRPDSLALVVKAHEVNWVP